MEDSKIKKLNQDAERHAVRLEALKKEISEVIVGQEDVIDKVLIALIADGHILLEGVPGLAKTLLIKTLAKTLGLRFCRIQFTPDLLPADIMGTKIYDHRKGVFTTQKGPIFSNLILADEINRAPPKVQSALLESMQEYQVTISGDTLPLDKPFLVLATQNPIETEGTYLLPEAQVDRFMFKIIISYPDRKQEMQIIKRNTGGEAYSVKKVMDQKELLAIQSFCRNVYADEKVEEYVSRIVDCTRHPDRYGLDLNGLIEYGASPRASIWLILAAKANAVRNSRGYVIPEDVKDIANDVLRHRILLTFEAEAEDVTTDGIIKSIIEKIKVP